MSTETVLQYKINLKNKIIKKFGNNQKYEEILNELIEIIDENEFEEKKEEIKMPEKDKIELSFKDVSYLKCVVFEC